MRQRTIIFVILAAVFGFGTIYFARSWLSRHEQVAEQPKPQQTNFVLVAARDLATGSFVRPEDLRWQAWPEGQVADTYLLKGKDTPEALSGAVVRLNIAAGEPVTNSRLVKPGDRGFLAAVLNPGMRAVTVPVTAVSGIAGLVFPGDHVDVVLSHVIQSTDAKTTQPAFASETVLTDLRVLATDQSTEDIKGKAAVAHTVTFEATPKQVEALEVASKLGSIALSLRGLPGSDLADASGALGDDGVPEQKGVRSVSHTWDSDVSPLIHHGPGSGETITVLRGQGGGDTKIDVTINNKASAPTPNPNGSGPEKLTGGS
ncbi:MAG TPA: Flp pilus assembly protein CpaB [Stellaceae bacterium]|nr:Flp pilus assembly protein CpaB [Stellaceae bacterium]